jgi:hypothetical protein
MHVVGRPVGVTNFFGIKPHLLLTTSDLADHLGEGPLMSASTSVAQDALLAAIGDGASIETLQRRLGAKGGSSFLSACGP